MTASSRPTWAAAGVRMDRPPSRAAMGWARVGAASVALLELRDVAAGYGSIQILHGVSLHVDPGEVVSVIGPNGAGKSTTFKIIMGLITHLGGEIVFDGRTLIRERPDRILALGLGYVPQGRIVFGTM